MVDLTLKEARNFLYIDKDDLSEEIIKHSQLMYSISERRVEAESLRDEAKDKYEYEQAVAANKYRRRHEDGKITETEIKQKVGKDKEVNERLHNYRRTKSKAAEWLALEEAFRSRGYMLRELSRIYVATNYNPEEGLNKGLQEARKSQSAARDRSRSRRRRLEE